MARKPNFSAVSRTHDIILGPVVNIWATFSNAYILKNKRIKGYNIKGIGCPLLISINFDQETEK